MILPFESISPFSPCSSKVSTFLPHLCCRFFFLSIHDNFIDKIDITGALEFCFVFSLDILLFTMHSLFLSVSPPPPFLPTPTFLFHFSLSFYHCLSYSCFLTSSRSCHFMMFHHHRWTDSYLDVFVPYQWLVGVNDLLWLIQTSTYVFNSHFHRVSFQILVHSHLNNVGYMWPLIRDIRIHFVEYVDCDIQYIHLKCIQNAENKWPCRFFNWTKIILKLKLWVVQDTLETTTTKEKSNILYLVMSIVFICSVICQQISSCLFWCWILHPFPVMCFYVFWILY